jgi:cell division protein FtsB
MGPTGYNQIKKRLRRLPAGILLLLWAGFALAQDIAQLEEQVAAKLTELESLKTAVTEQQRAAEELDAQLKGLQGRTAALEQARADALEAMNAQYQRIIADPDLELTDTRNAYRLAVEEQKDNQDAIAAKEQEIARQRQQIERSRGDVEAAEKELAGLRRGYDAARIARAERELGRTGSISVTNTITCARDETIADCIARGEREAQQAALSAYAQRLLAQSSEAESLAVGPESVTPELKLMDSRVESSGFRGQGDYFVEMQARVRSRITRDQACTLLALTDAQCSAAAAAGDTGTPTKQSTAGPASTTAAAAASAPPAAASTAPAAGAERAPPAGGEPPAEAGATSAAEQPTAPGSYMLTVRSNVYYDEVYIDGVPYGSTRVDVMLPAGEYDIEVRKPGYSTWSGRVTLKGAETVIAELNEQ